MFKGLSTFVKSIMDGREPQEFLKKSPKLTIKLKKLREFLLEFFKTLLFTAIAAVAVYWAGGLCWLFMQILTLFILPEIPVDPVIDPPVKLKPVTPSLGIRVGAFIFCSIVYVILVIYIIEK
jgi:hypothetical protein